jgi:hypothetical protein
MLLEPKSTDYQIRKWTPKMFRSRYPSLPINVYRLDYTGIPINLYGYRLTKTPCEVSEMQDTNTMTIGQS